MEFQILGPLEVVQGGTRVAISGRRERSLLGFLLLSPNQVVSSERVVEDLWSDSPPERAFSALHVCVSRLRKALGEGGDDVLVTRAPGYVLRVEPNALDAARFETLLATGQAQAARGEHRVAAGTFREALALWRGPALADLADLPAARAEAARLEEARLSALEARIEADLACGRHGELVGELEALTRAHPLRERSWAQRMVALYRSGRQAEALRAYQELRALLSEELGLEPSSHLRRLERAMLRQDPELDWTPGVPWTRPVELDAPERGVMSRVPFVGRKAELSRLQERLAKAAGGRGGLVFIAGEPGIGKTRLVEELAEAAQEEGVSVLWGRCVEGEWAPPYAPFMEALEALAGAAAPEQLRSDLGAGAAPLAGLVPRLRRVLPDLPEAHPVQPDEARFRLLDAMSQLLLARTMRTPVLLCLDDLHWADAGTIAMLRHLCRFAPQHRLLVLGAYRHVEVGRGHPLAEALDSLRREPDYERVRLEGLGHEAVQELLLALAEQDVPEALTVAIATETEGNPFFIRELVRHLVEEGKVSSGPEGRWTSDLSVRELGIPEGIRETIGRRLSRLSEAANRLLGVACGFEASFDFDTVAEVAGLAEADALDALDECLAAQVIQPVGGSGAHIFTHALIRHTLYEDLSSPRRVRLHRRLAEALWSRHGAELSPTRAGEITSQYYRSAGLPGAEQGVEPALLAAGHAEATGAHDEAARFLRMAIDLLPAGDSRRPRLLGRLGIALAWARNFEEAVEVASEAGAAIAETEDADEAVEYLSEATYACGNAGSSPHAWALAGQGLARADSRRGVAWARLISFEYERRAAADPEHPGIPLDTPERRESARILREARLDPLGPGPTEAVFSSRDEALASTNLMVLIVWAGEYSRCRPLLTAEAVAALARGELARAARCWSMGSLCQVALGDIDEARHSVGEAQALAARVGQPIFPVLQAQMNLSRAVDDGWEALAPTFQGLIDAKIPGLSWALSLIYGGAAMMEARLGRAEAALQLLDPLVPRLERSPVWTVGLSVAAHDAAETLWLLEHLDHAEAIERCLEKIVAADFRWPMVDGRLSLARLCALQGRHREAVVWFAEARRVLDEQGARPLLAIADYDEALTYIRRAGPGDAERARPLLDSARRQFEAMGMTGWICRANELGRRLG